MFNLAKAYAKVSLQAGLLLGILKAKIYALVAINHQNIFSNVIQHPEGRHNEAD